MSGKPVKPKDDKEGAPAFVDVQVRGGQSFVTHAVRSRRGAKTTSFITTIHDAPCSANNIEVGK